MNENIGNAKLKIVCIQMESKLGCPDENFDRAVELLEEALKEQPDVIVLPEIFDNPGELKERMTEFCCKDGDKIKARIGGFAKEHGVNIVAGSVSEMHNGKFYNTAFVFDRCGDCIATYDKIQLVYPGEFKYYTEGDSLCTFVLDGVKCGLIICNDLKFPELARSLALDGINILFVPSAWPEGSIFRMKALRLARAIENQIFVVNCNSCSHSIGKVYGGQSAIIEPIGKIISSAGPTEEIISAECDLQMIEKCRAGGQSIFDRRHPELY
ncbi:MAG: carbon-nitrogen family hydrolase [Clostridia bacterium]|nr:carbon-nitrogen family hydrolase [Clostridia bacterium]